MPKISIITVCYNPGSNLQKTIDSVLSQDFTDFEYIIVDGASTDGTPELLKKYQGEIKFISEPDKGIYNAMNKAINMSSGEYLQFLNAGDYLNDPQVLSKMFAEKHTQDIVFGDFFIASAEGDRKLKAYASATINAQYLAEYFLPHTSSFIRKDLFEKYGMYDESYRIAGDYEFFLRVINKHNASVKHVPVVVSVYDMEGISANPAHLDRHLSERDRAQRANLTPRQYARYVGKSGWLMSHLKPILRYFYLLLLKPFVVVLYLLLKSLPFKPIKKRVLLVPEYDTFGGSRTYFKQILEFYSSQGFEVALVVRERQLDEEILKLLQQYNYKHYLLPDEESFLKLLKSFHAIRNLLYDWAGLYKAYFDFKPEFITASVGTQGLYLKTIIYPAKWLYVLHSYPVEKTNLLDSWILKTFLGKNKRIVTVSHFSKTQIEKYWLNDKPSTDVKIIHNISSLPSNFHPEKKSHEKLTILTIGHVEDWKNPKFWVMTAKQVSDQIGKDKVEFIWAGDGTLLQECAQMAEDYENIQFVGYKTQDELSEMFAGTDIYFQPSKVESFGISVVDAMRSSISVVVTPVGGLTEVVEDGQTGVIVEEDLEKTTQEIVKLINDPSLRKQMGEAGLKRYQDMFSEESWYSNLLELHKTN